MRFIDQFLNSITMYRLVLYGLTVIVLCAVGLSTFGLLSYSLLSLTLSLGVVVFSCWLANIVMSWIFKVPTNVESAYITAFILFLILPPATSLLGVSILATAGLLAMASKYLLAWQGRHFFNPAALAVFILSFWPASSASWWVASAVLLPIVLLVGAAVVHKLRRWHMVGIFIATSSATILFLGLRAGFDLALLVPTLFTSWPIIFFGTIMLTEPLTAPTKLSWRLAYGAVVGILFGSQWSLGPVYPTPEFALLVGNLLSYFVSFSPRAKLTLVSKRQIANQIYEFEFTPTIKLNFQAGQYLEWTLAHANPDSRGNRRYFTIASAPSESNLCLGIRMHPQGSSFKRALLNLNEGSTIYATQVNGDFVLPQDASKKLVFIAGGIGITPFRSMIQEIINTQQSRDAILIYTVASSKDFAYLDIFKQAKAFGLQTELVVTDPDHANSEGWKGNIGRLTPELLQGLVPDYSQCHCYLSGPDAMVKGYTKLLGKMGVPKDRIRTDYFPGF